MRFFIAFFISLLIYLLLIWLFVTQFSNIEVPSKKMNNQVIKIDILDRPEPKIQVATPPAVVAKKEPIPIVKPNVPKKVEKKPTPKKVAKKKVLKKKIVKKKIVKKRPVVKKKPVKSKIKPKSHKKIVKKKKDNIKKDDDMVYIPEPFIVKPHEQKREKSDDLASLLGAAVPSRPANRMKSYPNKKIQKLYGSTFHTFTPTQKKFIEDNLNIIQRITQNTLTRRGYPEGAGRTGQEGTNVVSFNLHPNGNISDLRLKRRIGYRALDDNTLELIKTAYKDYPYPSTTTKIVFYVTYSIYGY